jgi:tetratricopeptide (TPR) repeat protein
MNTHPRCLLAFSLTSALTLSLLPTMACGGGSPGAAGDGPEATTGDEVEVGPSACEGQVLLTEASPQVAAPEDPLRCDELSTPAPVPLPTTASCRALGAEERAVCTARVRARARVTRPLGEARAAALASNWPEAIAKLEAAVVIVVDEPDVLAELGWARFRAREWCMATQDSEALEAERDSPSDGGEPSAIAVLCTGQVSLHQALEELELAANAAPSLELRATWEHQRAQVSAALGEEGDAAQAARRSLCARENPEVREMLAAQLWNTANRLGPAAPEESIGLYRQALMLAPSPEREEFVRDVLAVLGQPISFEAAPPVQPQAFFPSVEALCQALVLRDMSEPVDPSELPEDLCEVSDWDEVGLTRGEEVDVQFHAAVLTVQSPELYDGPVQTNYLVARSPRGVNVLLYLGEDHGESRSHNAFVGSPPSPYIESADAPLVVTWDVWGSGSLRVRLAVLAPAPPGQPCAGWWRERRAASPPPTSGPPSTPATRCCATMEQSLGKLRRLELPRAQRQPRRLPSSFALNVTAQELAATRESDGAMLCLPLRETLSPLRQPAAGQ